MRRQRYVPDRHRFPIDSPKNTVAITDPRFFDDVVKRAISIKDRSVNDPEGALILRCKLYEDVLKEIAKKRLGVSWWCLEALKSNA